MGVHKQLLAIWTSSVVSVLNTPHHLLFICFILYGFRANLVSRTRAIMKKNITLLSIIVMLYLSGCASSNYFEPTPITEPGMAMVYIYRPAATNPGKKPLTRSYPEVMVDGVSSGFLKYQQYLAVEVSPGQREFLVTGLTKGAKWGPRDLNYTLNAEAGQSYFLRYRVKFDMNKMSIGSFKGQYIINLGPVAETDAVYEISDTSKATAN